MGEEQLILRLPDFLAERLRFWMDKDGAPGILPQGVRLEVLDDTGTKLAFHMDKKIYPARLANMPTVVETWKTHDHQAYVKSSDVGQMIVVDPQPFPPDAKVSADSEVFAKSLKEIEKEMELTEDEHTQDERVKVQGGRSLKSTTGLTPPTNKIVQRIYRKVNKQRSMGKFSVEEVQNVEKIIMQLLDQGKGLDMAAPVLKEELLPTQEYMRKWPDEMTFDDDEEAYGLEHFPSFVSDTKLAKIRAQRAKDKIVEERKTAAAAAAAADAATASSGSSSSASVQANTVPSSLQSRAMNGATSTNGQHVSSAGVTMAINGVTRQNNASRTSSLSTNGAAPAATATPSNGRPALSISSSSSSSSSSAATAAVRGVTHVDVDERKGNATTIAAGNGVGGPSTAVPNGTLRRESSLGESDSSDGEDIDDEEVEAFALQMGD